MIQTFLSMPLPIRLLILFLIGSCLGAAVNLGIYRLAYWRRRISPWSRPQPPLARRGFIDRIPILGWWPLRREAWIHGRGFWIRPMLIELCFGLGVAGLYWWEIEKFMVNTLPLAPGFHPVGAAATAALHAQWAIHVTLIALMAAASFIDFDDLSIPDAITLPGTLVALAIGCLCTSAALPSLQIDLMNPRVEDLVAPLRFDYPQPALAFLAGPASLAIGLACFWGWCFALLPRRWRVGVGIVKAWRVMWRRIAARTEWRWVLVLSVFGGGAIAAVWWRGGQSWRGLFSALVGLAVGAGMIWIIRILGGTILKREAMGFGDVTLMAMIGAFLGWQAALIVFFISPLAGILAGLAQLVFRRDNVIPYGPYLCLGALVTIVFWPAIWSYTNGIFEVPWLAPMAIAVCLPVLVVMLYICRLLRPGITG